MRRSPLSSKRSRRWRCFTGILVEWIVFVKDERRGYFDFRCCGTVTERTKSMVLDMEKARFFLSDTLNQSN